MSQMKYGCQTYPWKMNIEKFAGDMPHIIATTATAGFAGLEAEICMLGGYFDRPDDFAALLAQSGVEFAALVLHQPWEHPEETEEERLLTEKAIAFVSRFPRAKLMVSHHAKAERGEGLCGHIHLNGKLCPGGRHPFPILAPAETVGLAVSQSCGIFADNINETISHNMHE